MKVAYDFFFSPFRHIDSVMSHRGAIKLVLCPISLIWCPGGRRYFRKNEKTFKTLDQFFGAVLFINEQALENATTKTGCPIFRSSFYPKIIILVFGRLDVWLPA